MKCFAGIVIFQLLLVSVLWSQDKATCDGYISNLALAAFSSDTSKVFATDLLNSRLNTAWYQAENFSFVLQGRNQFIFGKNSDLYTSVGKDKGLMDLTFGHTNHKSFTWNLQVDRLFAEYTYKSSNFTVGRQRINWGRTLVWNPNDIFNSYSFYDFDYVERPGTDALRWQYFTGAASSFELVVASDSLEKANIGVLWRTNALKTDIQLLAAFLNNQEFCFGTGWEGSIGPVASRGEVSYYCTKERFTDTTGVVLASLGFDVMINSKISLQGEFLYNDKKTRIADFSQLYKAPMNSKSLSFSEYNYYLGTTWQINPITNFTIAGMYYTDQKGYFVMPSLQISLTDNFTLNVLYQYFNMEQFGHRFNINYLFGGLKWNF